MLDLKITPYMKHDSQGALGSKVPSAPFSRDDVNLDCVQLKVPRTKP